MDTENKKRKAGANTPAGKVLLADILLVAVILVSFAFFHHVLPAINAGYFDKWLGKGGTEIAETEPEETASQETVLETPADEAEAVEAAVSEEETSETETAEAEAAEAETEETEAVQEEETAAVQKEETATETVANEDVKETAKEIVDESVEEDTAVKTEWQIKFADKFTDEIVQTENSYSSPNVSITIDTVVREDEDAKITYYVADIYVASLDNFRTYTVKNKMAQYTVQDAVKMDISANALISMNGDYYAFQSGGFFVRNGELYRSDYTTCSICVMYHDGTVECYPAGGYDVEEILAKDPYQIWNFGPTLLNEDGTAATDFSEVSRRLRSEHPRSALGYYEPGHYCFVVVDGRQNGYSEGISLENLAKLMEELGCTEAYNLDGGASSVLVFDHERYNRASNGAKREMSDIIYICETVEETATESGGAE